MLIIREEQMAAFRAAAVDLFEQRMVIHLERFGAPSLVGLDHRQLRTGVRSGVAQAKRGGFSLRGPVRLYLESMVILGHHFHDDPQYRAIAATLADPGYALEMDRAQALFDALLDYREQVVGQEQEHLRAALEGLQSIAADPVAVERNRDDLANLLWYVYPEKAVYVGAAGLHVLIRQAQALIRTPGMHQERDAALTCVLMMIFGHGCFADPFLPWIEQALAGGEDVSASLPGSLLQKPTQTRVQQMLANYKTPLR